MPALGRYLGILLLSLLLAASSLTAVAQEATPSTPPTQPEQPATGPGGSEAPFDDARLEHYGEAPGGFWIWEPVADWSAATPVAAGPFPVILYLSGCCGLPDYPTPDEVGPWMFHLSRQGYVVIAPVYHVNTPLEDIPVLLQQALDELGQPGHSAIDLEQFAVVAYSYGGVPAIHYASSAAEAGLPVPDALFLTAPCMGPGFCVEAPVDPVFPEGMKVVILAYAQDGAVGVQTPKDVYATLESIPEENREFVTMQTDDHGEPPIRAVHEVPYQVEDAADWFGLWKLSSALLSCTFTGEFCDVAMGNTPEQRYMGKWSDGTAVTELVVADDASFGAVAVASPVAIDPAAVAGAAMPFGNEARTGETGQAGIQGVPTTVWQAQASDLIYGPPVVSDGAVFLTTFSAVEAHDSQSGALLWSIPRPSAGSAVALQDGVLYFGTFGEGLWAVDATNGQERWRYQMEEPDPASDPPQNVIDSTPLIVDGVIYLNGGPWGGIYAVDAESGEEIWRFDTAGGTGAQLSFADGILYQPVDKRFDGLRGLGEPPGPATLVAVDATSGEEVWHFEAEEGSSTFATPVVADGVVLFGISNPDNNAGAYLGIDASSGEELWRIPMHAMWGTTSAASGGIFFLTGAFDGGVYAVDTRTGESRWEHQTDGALVQGLLLAGDLLYVQSDDGVLAALNPFIGGEAWAFETFSTKDAGTPTMIGVRGEMIFAVGNGDVMAIAGDGSPFDGEFTSVEAPEPPELEGDISTFAAFSGTLEFPEPVTAPEGIAFAEDGTTYVVDADNDRIAIFDADGGFVEFWGSTGSGENEFQFHSENDGWRLGDLAIAADGGIFVLDAGNQRIQKYSADRTFVASLGGPAGEMGLPGGFAIDEVNGRIFVASLDHGSVLVYDMEGTLLESWGTGGRGDAGEFATVTDIAVGSQGSIFVAEHGRGRIRVYSPEGVPIEQWGGIGVEAGRLAGPWGIALDGDDNLIVADYLSNHVVVYAADGSVVGLLGGEPGSGDELTWPSFAAAGQNGTIFVSEEGSGEVSIFTVGGMPAASPEASPEA